MVDASQSMHRPSSAGTPSFSAKNWRVALLGLGLGLGSVLVYRVRVRFGLWLGIGSVLVYRVRVRFGLGLGIGSVLVYRVRSLITSRGDELSTKFYAN